MYKFEKARADIAQFARENGYDLDWAELQASCFEDWFYENQPENDTDEEWAERSLWATIWQGYCNDWLNWSYDNEDWQRRERKRTLKLPILYTHVDWEPDPEDAE